MRTMVNSISHLVRRAGWRLNALALTLLASPLFAATEEAGDHAAGGGGLTGQMHLEPRLIIAQIVGFLVMMLILWLTVFRRVGGVLDKRRDDIVTRLNEIERNQAEAARLKDETQEQLANIQREAQQRLQLATERAEAEGNRIIQEARQAAQAETERGRRQIEQDTNAAITTLRSEVADLVVQATRRILQENLDEARQRRVVDEMISKLSN
ncbi:MAG: F0F1 ATP synthase subunit B [Candidatus Poribacteria bacterium]|nr:F0F1 ATP synthase subunit B [Candidatus Poribacteria bacterium]